MKKTVFVLTSALAMAILFLPVIIRAAAPCDGPCTGPQTVPEPATLALLASGIGSIGLFRYFRKK